MGAGDTKANEHPQHAEEPVGRSEWTGDTEYECPQYGNKISLICDTSH